ncbi:MAG: ASCH domain-containing protein [Candidatus Merdivicinus sp.]|jgi:uncharacterized protein YhfF
MQADLLWEMFAEKNGMKDVPYEVWAFGGAPDELAELVVNGEKTATSSAHALYAADGESLPEENSYSVIVNSREEAVCIIRTTRVSVVPFHQVGEDHAYREGEGDKSLEYWRKIHAEFFQKALGKAGIPFHDGIEVVCEEFEVVFRPD